MKRFDIDSFVPDYKSDRYYLDNRYSFGVKSERLLNWRGIEKRMFELFLQWNEASDRFNKMVSEFKRKGIGNGYFGLVVAIDDPNLGNDRVLKFSEHGHTVDFQTRMVDYFLDPQNPVESDSFVFYPYHTGGRELGKIYRREIRLHKVYATYRAAFQRAVSDRILCKTRQDFLDKNFRRIRYLPAVFIIKNEDRQYIVSSSPEGSTTWIDGEIYSTDIEK